DVAAEPRDVLADAVGGVGRRHLVALELDARPSGVVVVAGGGAVLEDAELRRGLRVRGPDEQRERDPQGSQRVHVSLRSAWGATAVPRPTARDGRPAALE